MQSLEPKKLSTKLARTSLLAVIACGLMLSMVQIVIDFNTQKRLSKENIQNIIKVTSSSAQRAVYQLDNDLANQVVSGLRAFSTLSEAKLLDETNKVMSEFAVSSETPSIWLIEFLVGAQKVYTEVLKGKEGEALGSLILTVDNNRVFDRFYSRALMAGMMIIAAALFIGLMLIYISNRQITLPLMGIARKLSSIDISDEKNAKIFPLKSHERDELGQIVTSANGLINNLVSRQETLHQRERELGVILDASPYPVFAINETDHIVFINKATCDFYQLVENNIVGKTFKDLHAPISPKQYIGISSEIEKVGLSKEANLVQHKMTDGSGIIHTMQLSIVGFMLFDSPSVLVTTTDISARVQAEQRIEKLAYYDALTNLPNRNQVNERLKRDIADSQVKKVFGAVVFIDLDDFKRINDSKGHSFGDRLLQQVAKKINAKIRSTETLARLGGDEFILSLPDLSSDEFRAKQKASDLANRLLESIREPVVLDGSEYIVSASIGVALYSDGESVEELLQHADTAMYRAKRNGRDHFEIFEPSMAEENKRIVKLESEIRNAIANENFTFYIQPLVHSSDTSLASGEALLRWEHPQRGLIMPGEFIEFLESSAMINDVGDFILEKVCQFICVHNDVLKKNTRIAVNIASKQLYKEDFVQYVESLLHKYHISGKKLEFEITESSALQNIDDAIEKMLQLKNLGITFSLDDFGTGYSSLGYLKVLPVDKIKIDKSFINDIMTDEKDTALVSSIISIARNLDLKIVAEGVETQEQVDWLSRHGDVILQGYHFSRPIKHSEFAQKYLH